MRAAIIVCVLAAGCATGEQSGSRSAASSSSGSGSAERTDEPGSTRASREAAREEDETDDPSGATGPAPSPAPSPSTPSTPSSPSDRPVLSMHPVDVDEAEDGHGETVKAADPVAFDVDGRRFPPRAADPVLMVGELRFRRYTYPRAGVLRFVAADRGALPKGEPVFLQFGDDERTREQLADSLERVP